MVKSRLTRTLLTLVMFGTATSAQLAAAAPARPLKVLRYRSLTNRTHVFTTDGQEQRRSPMSFAEESVPDGLSSSPLFYLSTEPNGRMVRVYQFRAADGAMQFAANEVERAALRSSGLQEVQQPVYVYSGQVEGASEIYRLFNLRTGDVLYTTSSDEKDYYIKQGWMRQPSLGFTQATSSSGTGVLRGTTVKLDERDVSLLSEAVKNDGKLVFSNLNEKLAALGPGTVLYSEKNDRLPLGLIATVKSVSPGPFGTTEVETTPARLTDAFEQYHIFIDNLPLHFLPSDSDSAQPDATQTPFRQARSEVVNLDATGRTIRPDYLEETVRADAAGPEAASKGTWSTALAYNKNLLSTACCSLSVAGNLSLSVTGEINTDYSLFPASYSGEVLFTPVLTGSVSSTASLTVGLSQDDISLLPAPIAATFPVGGIPVTASVDLLAGFGITGSVSGTISSQVTMRATGGFSFDLNLSTPTVAPVACPNPCPNGFSCGSGYGGGNTCSLTASGSASFTTDNAAFVYVKPRVGLGPGLSVLGFKVAAEAALATKLQLEAKIEPPNLNFYAELLPEVSADISFGRWTWTPIAGSLGGYSTRIWQIALGSSAAITVQANPSNGGRVSGGGTFPFNSQHQIAASPYGGWTFTGWNDGSKQNPRTITVPSSGATYTANFQGAATPPLPPVATYPGASTDSSSPIGTTTPTMTWNASPGADTYRLYISKYPYGSNYIIYLNESIAGSKTSVQIPSGYLSDGGRYRWNMSAHNSAGWGSTSNTLYFQVSLSSAIETISMPVASGPSAGAVGLSYTLGVATSAVSSSAHRIRYKFDFGNGTYSELLPVGVSSASNSWPAAGTYSVRVQAICETHTAVWSPPSPVLLVAITSTPAETISAPGTPTGTSSGFTNAAYGFSTSGASSSASHPLQYQFSFENGDNTPWLSPGVSATKTWFTPGLYPVTVKARCLFDNQVISPSSGVLNVTITNPAQQETILAINPPGGPNVATTGAGYRYYDTGGGRSSLNHPIEYRFDWNDGTAPVWLAPGTNTADKTWANQGNFGVTIQSRCSVHTNIVSAVSNSYPVAVTSPSGSIQMLANGLSSPLSLAVDATRVYWTDSGSGRVLSIPSDASTNNLTVLASGMVKPSGIAVDDNYVYFSEGATNSSTIRKVPKLGGTVTPIQTGLTSVFRIASDANNIYWTDPEGGTIRSSPKSGGSSTILASDPGNSPSGIAVDSTNVYWTQMVQPGNVMRVPLSGGTGVYTGFATNAPGIAGDGTFVYWTQHSFTDGQVKSNYVGKGGQESILAGSLSRPYDLAVDSSSVFWVEEYTGNVKQVSTAGGTPLTLASGLANPTAIAVDSSSVYWLEYNYGSPAGGVLRKAPKQAPAPVIHVTVQTTVPGIVYNVDDHYYQDSPQRFTWVPGSTHTLTATVGQNRPGGGRYQFASWSDGGSMSHTVSPSTDTTYTAIVATQFYLAVIANGMGSANAVATGFQNQGQAVAISATPDPGYTFLGWDGTGAGSYTGPLNNVSVTMNDQIIQSANFSRCSYALASSGQGFLSVGGSSSVSLTVLPGCPWQAASNVPWIGISSGGTGSGSGSVTFAVEAYTTGTPRTGTLTVGGLTFTINQTSVSTCSYSAAPPKSLFSPTGGIGVASVTATYPCSWTASSADSWITIPNGSRGVANGSTNYFVSPNGTGASRVGTITVAGQAVTITQSGKGMTGPLQFPAFHDVMNSPNFKTALGADGSLIVASAVPTGGLQLVKSTDGGATFSPPVLIADSVAVNYSFDMAVDSSNSIHVTWWGSGGPRGSDIYYARSSDGGASFGPRLTVRTGSAYSGYLCQGGSDPKVTSDGLGNVAVVYPGGARDLSGSYHGNPIWISMSTDGGVTFRPEFYANVPDGNNYSVSQLIARSGSLFMVEHDDTNGDNYFYRTTSTTSSHTIARMNQVLHKAGYRASVAVDPDSTTMYAAYVDTSISSNGDIYSALSRDGGATWESYRRVTSTISNGRYSPLSLLDASGGLHFFWVDDGIGQTSQIVYAYSSNKGASFSASVSIPASAPANDLYGPQALIDQAHAILHVFGASGGARMVMTSSVPAPVLQVAKSHSGNFTVGHLAAYNISVYNLAGAGPTTGTVTVTDSAPAGLTLVSLSGTGWTCPSGSPTCARNDSLAGGSSYPAITASFNVAANATSPFVNSVVVSGGGSASASATDSATMVGLPALSISKSHAGNFTQGQNAATYTVTVSNATGAGPTSGMVTMTETVPAGMTLVSMSAGATWNCSVSPTCTTSGVLDGGSSYPAITVTVNVAANAGTPLSNSVTVSGGGSATNSTNDSTVIAAIQSITFGALASKTLGTAPFGVSATASSGLAVNFNSQTTPVCTVSSATVTLVTVGTCTIQATQAGNANYAAATSVNRSFQVTPNASTNGVITPGSTSSAPGGTFNLPITLTLNAGISVDALTIGLQILPAGGAPPLAGSLSFTKDASIADAPFVSSGGTSNAISVVWASLGSALSSTRVLGTVSGTIPSGATTGQSYTVAITGVSATSGGGGNPVTVNVAPSGTLNVVNTPYKVGDVAPFTTDAAPNFGDGKMDILDLIQVLFAVNSVPGFRPAACSDRFDAMDLFPADAVSARGGDGVLDIRDLIRELFRVNNLDPDRPVRSTRGGVCATGGSATAPVRESASFLSSRSDSDGSLVFGASEAAGAEERIPVYLEARSDLGRVAVTFALGDQKSHLRFFAAPDTQPSFANDGQLGILALAWLEGLSVRAGERILLGYVVGPKGTSTDLRIYGSSASGLDDNREVRLNATSAAGRGR